MSNIHLVLKKLSLQKKTALKKLPKKNLGKLPVKLNTLDDLSSEYESLRDLAEFSIENVIKALDSILFEIENLNELPSKAASLRTRFNDVNTKLDEFGIDLPQEFVGIYEVMDEIEGLNVDKMNTLINELIYEVQITV
jgi:hypothetical protein